MHGRSVFQIWFSLMFITLLALAGCGGGSSDTPVTRYTVGGTVTGLSGAVLLQNSGGDDLSVSSDGSFTFATPVNAGAAYAISILIQPEGQTCFISDSAGVVAAGNVSNVVVACSATAIGAQMGGARQGVPLNLSAAVTTLAGTAGRGSTDATGTAARFNSPYGTTTDGTNLYVADTDNHTIRKIVIATGVVTTLAGAAGESGAIDGMGAAARFSYPAGIATDGTHLYVADSRNNTIRTVVIATGAVTTLAGAAGESGLIDGAGAAARFNVPSGITTDGAHLYVTDSANGTIRKIVIATGVVSTLAGAVWSLGKSSAIDATGTAASFSYPKGISTDGVYLYIADTGNHTIRKIVIATGVVTTLAGTAGEYGTTDATGTAARFLFPEGITSDGTHLYVADSINYTVRKIVIATGVVTTLAGAAETSGSVNATGVAARFGYLAGITTDGTHLYVADLGNSTIRKIVVATGAVSTLAGVGGGTTDATGVAARFSFPAGITTDGVHLYLTDNDHNTIRKIVIATGVVTTLAGAAAISGAADGPGSTARFNFPVGITTDGIHLYVADTGNHTIRKIVIATGVVTTLAGVVGESGSIDATGTAARFSVPFGITTDGTYLYVADAGNSTIRKIVIATGVVTTLAGSAGLSGSTDATGTAARFDHPADITTDGTYLYVADTRNHTIRKIVIATGVVTTLAGTAGESGSSDAVGAAARFYFPHGITTDGTYLYVADSLNNTIRKIVIATGVVTTLAGSAWELSSTDAPGTPSLFGYPVGITTDGASLYVTNKGNRTISRIQ